MSWLIERITGMDLNQYGAVIDTLAIVLVIGGILRSVFKSMVSLLVSRRLRMKLELSHDVDVHGWGVVTRAPRRPVILIAASIPLEGKAIKITECQLKSVSGRDEVVRVDFGATKTLPFIAEPGKQYKWYAPTSTVISELTSVGRPGRWQLRAVLRDEHDRTYKSNTLEISSGRDDATSHS